jgi:hypothetical protein
MADTKLFYNYCGASKGVCTVTMCISMLAALICCATLVLVVAFVEVVCKEKHCLSNILIRTKDYLLA